MARGDTELIRKYRVSENLPDDFNLTESMIHQHWNLERELTRLLLESTNETRWEVFEQVYTRFYSELTWLSRYSGDGDLRPPVERYRDWVAMIGPPPKRIYEVGSGSARMLSYLAEIGYDCKATDITRERQDKHKTGVSSSLSWGNSDGVHLDIFEPPDFYEVVISDQVIEHFHPDDLIPHFKSVKNILTPGGRYIFNTPHRYTGPHDVSQVFDCDEPQGMHLKEYTFGELMKMAREAGFVDVAYAVPVRVRNLLKKLGLFRNEENEAIEKNYLRLMRLSENFLSLIPNARTRRRVAMLIKKCKMFKGDIFLSARKPL